MTAACDFNSEQDCGEEEGGEEQKGREVVGDFIAIAW